MRRIHRGYRLIDLEIHDALMPSIVAGLTKCPHSPQCEGLARDSTEVRLAPALLLNHPSRTVFSLAGLSKWWESCNYVRNTWVVYQHAPLAGERASR
jgi:hypothetical protein